MGFAYSKLQLRLSHKGYDIRAKELSSFACGYLTKIANVDVVGDWHIEVHTTGRFSGGVWFQNLRQVQRWADKGFKNEDLPVIPLVDGTKHKQTLRKAS